MTDIRIYPPWKEAVEIIAGRVKREGYGIIFSHEELLNLFDLKTPELATPEVWRKLQFDVLQSLESLKDALLSEHSIYLLNIRGLGYQALPPGEQVEVVPRKYMKKIHNLIMKSIKSLVHVADEMLDEGQQETRLRNLEKLAFLKGASGRKLQPLPGKTPDKLSLPDKGDQKKDK